MPQLPFVCLECKREYKTLAVRRLVKLGEVSHGICPECTKTMEATLYGSRVTEQAVEALR